MDVWLLFGLTLPFISFVLSILEELLQDSEEDEAKAFELFKNLLDTSGAFFTQAWSHLMNPKKTGCKVASVLSEPDDLVRMSKQRIVQIFGRISCPPLQQLLYFFTCLQLHTFTATQHSNINELEQNT